MIIRGAIVVGAAVAVLVSGLLGLLPFDFGGGGSGGGGSEAQPTVAVTPEGPAVAETTPPTEPLTEPLVVIIEERRYLVDGQPKTVQEIVELAATVPDRFRVKVVIKRRDTSRADAEETLAAALEAEGLAFEMKDE
jgi:hypothetical protein